VVQEGRFCKIFSWLLVVSAVIFIKASSLLLSFFAQLHPAS